MAAPASTATPPTGTRHAAAPPEAHYRPHLDGLRAIAVYLVVLFHAGVVRFSGGFVGVDVFFVLSGYLVTQLLLRDVYGQNGIRFGRFYARRYRRLLPAAFVALLVTAMVYAGIASPANVSAAVDAFKAAFLYVANWFFIGRSTAYFGGNIAQNPVLPYWSLAVEEQFYFVWPLLLTGIFALTARTGARQRTLVGGIVASLGVLSLVAAFALRSGSPAHAYYGTDARAYQLLGGALIALFPVVVSRAARYARATRFVLPITVVTLLLLASSWVHFDAIGRGALVTVTTIVLIIALEAAEFSPVNRLLSTRPAVYLGQVSYGTYLWHWPVILVMTTLLHLSALSTFLLTCLVATGIASLSFQVLERPVRLSPWLDRHRRAVIVSGLVVSVVSALVLVPAVLQEPSPARAIRGDTSTGFTPVPSDLDFGDATFTAAPSPPVCFDQPVSTCTIVQGSGKHLMLIGDSHARMLIPTFTRIARDNNLTLSLGISGGCPWQLGVYTPNSPTRCQRYKDDLYTRVIPQLKPDVVVAVNYGYDDPSIPPVPVINDAGQGMARGGLAFDRLMARATKRSAKALTQDGRDLVIVDPIPIDKTDPTECLAHSKFLESCRYVARTGHTKLETLYRSLADHDDHIFDADLDRVVCPFFPICDPVVDHHIVKVDGQHLTREFADYVAPEVASYLRAIDVIPRSK